jgi:pimeloyl-ACP methyl ester carboxylesterase
MIDASMSFDGRSLTYTNLGAFSSPLIMYFHGAPTSRLDLVPFEDALAALDVRVVSADRPGYGGSSPQAGRGLEDWPTDVAALADHLGVERFAVMGWSSGGPYAVACAALLPGRVASAGVVCGVTDFGTSDRTHDDDGRGLPAGRARLCPGHRRAGQGVAIRHRRHRRTRLGRPTVKPIPWFRSPTHATPSRSSPRQGWRPGPIMGTSAPSPRSHTSPQRSSPRCADGWPSNDPPKSPTWSPEDAGCGQAAFVAQNR